MQTLLDRDKKENERNYEWKKEVHDRSCYRTQKKVVVSYGILGISTYRAL